jgi:hypothetical protein
MAQRSQQWIQHVTAQWTWRGLFLGKRWEVLSDGVRGIGDGVGGIKGVEVEHVLCGHPLCQRIDEGLGAAEQKRKAKQPITQNHPIGRKLQLDPVNRGEV